MAELSVVGGGIAGLVASITAAEIGVSVDLFEAHSSLGGRARTKSGDWRANLGDHVFYCDGASWPWLLERKLTPPSRRSPVSGVRFYVGGRVRRMPPCSFMKFFKLRAKQPPDDESFRSWVTRLVDAETAETLSRAAGAFTFYHDPGALSASFVAERGARVLTPPPSNRYLIGGWQSLVDRLIQRARDLGVNYHTRSRVEHLPEPPVVVAITHADATSLLPEADLSVTLNRCACLDIGLRRRVRDPFLVSDLEHGGWLELYTKADRSLAPKGHGLIQGHMPMAPGESVEEAIAKLEEVADAGYRAWRERIVWRRQQVMDGMVGAVDPPGKTWRDRPAIDQGSGVFLAGDWVAAPGLLSEASFNSAIQAAELATGFLTVGRTGSDGLQSSDPPPRDAIVPGRDVCDCA